MYSKESNFNIGIIGIGDIGIIHADVLLEGLNKSRFVLIAVADPRPKQKYPGIDFYLDYNELLERPDIDTVTVATPPYLHLQMAKDSPGAGKNVLIEKPPALSLEELRNIEELATRSGLVLFTAFHSIYRPEVEAARQELADKGVQQVVISYQEPRLTDPNNWILDRVKAGGGVLMDSGINAISIVRRILPETSGLEVLKAQIYVPDNFQVETSAEVNFRFGGSLGTLKVEWMHQGSEDHKIIFYTSTDEYIVDKTQGQFIKNGQVLIGAKNTRVDITDQHPEYRGVYQDFGKHLRERRSYVSFQELKFVLDAYKVALTAE